MLNGGTHLDYLIDWAVYFDLNNVGLDISPISLQLQYGNDIRENIQTWDPLTVTYTLRSALSDLAPGPTIYDTVRFELSDTLTDFYPNWKKVDLQDRLSIEQLPAQFWIESHSLWLSFHDTTAQSGHTRSNVDTRYWIDVFDRAIRLVYEYQSFKILFEPGAKAIPLISELTIFPNLFNPKILFTI